MRGRLAFLKRCSPLRGGIFKTTVPSPLLLPNLRPKRRESTVMTVRTLAGYYENCSVPDFKSTCLRAKTLALA